MLAGNNDRIGQFAVEGVGVPRVDGGAERICVDGRIADVGFIGVDELDDGEKVLGVVVASLRFCEVEGAGARGVGWRRWCFRGRSGCWTVEAGAWWLCGPSARLCRRRWHDCVSCRIGTALAPARSVGDGGAGVVRICHVVACDRRCWWSARCGSRRNGLPLPRRGEIVDAALVVEAGVRGEVGLDVSVAVGGALNLVAGLVDGAGHEAGLVVAEILLDGGAEEVVVLGVVA